MAVTDRAQLANLLQQGWGTRDAAQIVGCDRRKAQRVKRELLGTQAPRSLSSRVAALEQSLSDLRKFVLVKLREKKQAQPVAVNAVSGLRRVS